MDTKKKILLIFIILIVLGGTGYYIWWDFIGSKGEVVENNPEDNSIVDIDVEKQTGDAIEKQQDQEAVKLLEEEGKSVPNLDREIPEGADQSFVDRIIELTADLKADSSLFTHWLELGIYRKNVRDYIGAKEAWEYASEIRPNNTTALNNLGDLYTYHLKDNQKAEEYLLKALNLAPHNVFFYYKLFEFYNDIVMDTDKARAVLEQGIELDINGAQDLQRMLDNLQQGL